MSFGIDFKLEVPPFKYTIKRTQHKWCEKLSCNPGFKIVMKGNAIDRIVPLL